MFEAAPEMTVTVSKPAPQQKKSPNFTRTVAFGRSVTFSLEYELWRWLAIYSDRYFRPRLEHKPLPLR